jgi:DNA-binding MarR family transcriptional regulator
MNNEEKEVDGCHVSGQAVAPGKGVSTGEDVAGESCGSEPSACGSARAAGEGGAAADARPSKPSGIAAAGESALGCEDELRLWWREIERLGGVLGRKGPDEVCCGGLSQRQCAILRTLVAREGAPLQELAAASGITPSAMTRVLEKLEARGLVERMRGTHKDGRAASVRITEAGRRVRQQLDGLMLERTQRIVEALPEARRAEVFAALRLLNLAMEGGQCCPLNTPVETLPGEETR